MRSTEESAGPPPLVSIVVAAWRPDPQQFEAALRSALCQTWPDVEILVADDSPNGEARGVADRLADPRLRYLRRQPPLGAARNHWRAFSEARGTYLAILNHDDLLEPAFVATLAGALEAEPRAVLAFCDHWVIDAAGRRQTEATEENSRRWGRDRLHAGLHCPAQSLVVRQSLPIAMGAVFRRSALPAQLPDTAGPAYDLWLGHLLCRGGAGAWYVPERLSAWRAHAGNLTSAAGPDWLEGSAACWADMAADGHYAPLRHQVRTQARLSYRIASAEALRRGQASAARSLARRSLAHGLDLGSLTLAGLSVLPLPLAQQVLKAIR